VVLGAAGVEKVITVRLTAEEQAAVEKSAREVQDSIAKLNFRPPAPYRSSFQKVQTKVRG